MSWDWNIRRCSRGAEFQRFSHLTGKLPVVILAFGPAPDLYPYHLSRIRVCVGPALFLFIRIFLGSRMSQDPKPASAPAKKPETLEDAVYKTSLSAGNDEVRRANPAITLPLSAA